MLSRYASRTRTWLNFSSPIISQSRFEKAHFIPIRTTGTVCGTHLSPSGTGGFELTFLGTGSQGGARRYPSCLALRLRGTSSSEVWLFDAGEGAIAQLQRSNMRVSLVRNIFITHLHGDHLYGLPGLVLSVLGGKELGNGVECAEPTLNVYGPPGVRAFLRMALGVAAFRPSFKNALCINELQWPSDFGPPGQNFRHRCASAYWKSSVKRLSFEAAGRDIEPEKCSETGAYTYHLTEEKDQKELKEDIQDIDHRWRIKKVPASITAAPILHTVPTFAYEVNENVVSRRFDKTKLRELGVPTDGRDGVRELFHSWLAGKCGVWQGKEIEVDDVMQPGRRPRRVCVVGDTYDAEGAAHIAKDVDVLIHEATNMAAQTRTARSRGHSSTFGATSFAKRVNAKRLILNHTSVSYSEKKIRAMEAEARSMFGANKAFVARDLSVFTVPTTEEDNENFLFRRFVGFADSLEYKSDTNSLLPQDFTVDEREVEGRSDMNIIPEMEEMDKNDGRRQISNDGRRQISNDGRRQISNDDENMKIALLRNDTRNKMNAMTINSNNIWEVKNATRLKRRALLSRWSSSSNSVATVEQNQRALKRIDAFLAPGRQ